MVDAFDSMNKVWRKFTSGLCGLRVVYARVAGAASAKYVLGDSLKVTSLAELAG